MWNVAECTVETTAFNYSTLVEQLDARVGIPARQRPDFRCKGSGIRIPEKGLAFSFDLVAVTVVGCGSVTNNILNHLLFIRFNPLNFPPVSFFFTKLNAHMVFYCSKVH